MADHRSRRPIAAVPLPIVLVGPDERVDVHERARHDALRARAATGRHYITAFRQPAVLDCIETGAGAAGPRGPPATWRPTAARDATWRVTAARRRLDGGAGSCCRSRTSPTRGGGQMRRDFVANVSHELRTPLTALLGLHRDAARGRRATIRPPASGSSSIMEREAGADEPAGRRPAVAEPRRGGRADAPDRPGRPVGADRGRSPAPDAALAAAERGERRARRAGPDAPWSCRATRTSCGRSSPTWSRTR